MNKKQLIEHINAQDPADRWYIMDEDVLEMNEPKISPLVKLICWAVGLVIALTIIYFYPR